MISGSRRRIADHGNPFCHRSRHHNIFRRSHTWKRQSHRCAAELFDRADDFSILFLDLRSHSAQSLQMNVHRPFTDVAAAGKSHMNRTLQRQHRSQKKYGRAQLSHQILVKKSFFRYSGTDSHSSPLKSVRQPAASRIPSIAYTSDRAGQLCRTVSPIP